MGVSKFKIPDELEDQVRYVDALDNRPEQEIIYSLESYHPGTPEKNIWAFWHSGIR